MNKSMDERSKRIRNKTKRYISTDEEKYQYKKKNKSNIDVRETFDFIKKAIAAKYDEENFEKHSKSGTGADTSDEDEQRDILAIGKEQPSLSCDDERNNFFGDLTNFSNNNQPLVPTIVSNHSDSSLSQNSHSTILSLNSHTLETLPMVTTKTAPSRKHDTDREQPKDHDQDSENVLTTNEHNNNAIKTGTLQQDFKSMIQTGFKSINDMLRKQQQQLNEINLQLKQNANTYAVPKKPSYFPMESVESLDRFDNCSVEEYKNTISFFLYLGGFNPKECVSGIIKESFTDDFSMTLTWTGYGNTIEIASRKFTAAIYEALARNNNFSKLQIAELKDAVTEGLRNAKQRVRNREKEKNGKKEKGKREMFAEKIKQNLDVLNI